MQAILAAHSTAFISTAHLKLFHLKDATRGGLKSNRSYFLTSFMQFHPRKSLGAEDYDRIMQGL